MDIIRLTQAVAPTRMISWNVTRMLPGARCPPDLPFFLPAGLRPPDPPLGRTGGRSTLAGAFCLMFGGFEILLVVYRPWEVSPRFCHEIFIECTQTQVWGPPGPEL